MFRARNSRSSAAVEYDTYVLDRFADYLQGIQQRRSRNNCRAMLVVMEYRNLHPLFQGLFDVEALRRLDILQVDATKRRLQQLANLDHIVWICRIHLKIEYVHVRKTLEQHSFSLHYWFSSKRADVPEAQHCRSV